MRVRRAMRAMVARGTDARRRYGRWNAKTTHPRTRSPLQEGLNLPTPSSHAARLLLAHSCSLPQHSPKPHTANAAHGAVRLPTALRLHMLAERPIRSATPPTKPPPTPRSLPAVTPLWRWRGGVQAGEGGTCVPSASQSTPYPCAGVRRGVRCANVEWIVSGGACRGRRAPSCAIAAASRRPLLLLIAALAR